MLRQRPVHLVELYQHLLLERADVLACRFHVGPRHPPEGLLALHPKRIRKRKTLVGSLKSRLLSEFSPPFRRFHVGVWWEWRLLHSLHMDILMAHLTTSTLYLFYVLLLAEALLLLDESSCLLLKRDHYNCSIRINLFKLYVFLLFSSTITNYTQNSEQLQVLLEEFLD